MECHKDFVSVAHNTADGSEIPRPTTWEILGSTTKPQLVSRSRISEASAASLGFQWSLLRLALAKLCYLRGAKVTILARTKKKLELLGVECLRRFSVVFITRGVVDFERGGGFLHHWGKIENLHLQGSSECEGFFSE